MKKLFALLMALVIVASMGTVAFAEKGGFVYSPSVNPAPVIVEESIESPDCGGDIVITPYDGRNTLDDESKKAIEEAYDDILNSDEGNGFTDLIDGLSDETGIPDEFLLVSDLFNIDITDCGEHDGHGKYSVKLSSSVFSEFVGLAHYEGGEWKQVDASIDSEGVLSLSYAGFGPFAVIVDASATASPPTGDNGIMILCIVLMAVSAVGLVTVFVASKKRKAVEG